MELWIRSQDREQLALINELYIRCSCKEMPCQATYYIENKDLLLGIYKTKERALEILDEIQNIIKPRIITTKYECECKGNDIDKLSFDVEMTPTKTEIQELSTYVYEMPKE